MKLEKSEAAKGSCCQLILRLHSLFLTNVQAKNIRGFRLMSLTAHCYSAQKCVVTHMALTDKKNKQTKKKTSSTVCDKQLRFQRTAKGIIKQITNLNVNSNSYFIC